MQDAIVRFPLGRTDAVRAPALRNPAATLTCRWQVNSATGRLEQVWAVTAPSPVRLQRAL
jgi:hypothetical protein